MKRILMVLVAAASLSMAGAASAEEKPDCSAQKTASDDAMKATKAKPDLSSCADKKGKEKSECEKPLKEAHKTAMADAKTKAKEAKMALDCCMHPKKKGCGEAAAAPAGAAPAPAPAPAPK